MDFCGENGYCCKGTEMLGDGTCTDFQPSVLEAGAETHVCVTRTCKFTERLVTLHGPKKGHLKCVFEKFTDPF